MKFFILLFSSALFATFSEPFTFEMQTGYREDHLNWRLKPEGDTNLDTYHEQYTHLRLWQNNLVFQSIHRDIYILAEGGYGSFGKGDMNQNSIRNLSKLSYTFQTDAVMAYGKGIFGYFVNLTPMRYYRIGLIPLVGYSIYHTKIRRKNPNPHLFHAISSIMQDPVEVFSSLHRDLKLQWYGPFLGGVIYIYPGAKFVFEAGYHYHRLQMRQIVYNEFLMRFFDSTREITRETNQIEKGKIRIGNNLGHQGILKATYLLSKYIRLSVLGKLFYFSTQATTVHLEKQIQQVAPVVESATQAMIERNYKGRHVFWFTVFGLDFLL